MLWKDIFYGPVLSRRLGYSLGVNLLPRKRKICNFNCVYCECGLNDNKAPKEPLPTVEEYRDSIIQALTEMNNKGQTIDHITFSGNGEPTLHPDFDKIIDITIENRNKYYPESKIAVLTNSTNLHLDRVFNSLLKIEKRICKLDAGTERIYQLIDAPETGATLDHITEKLIRFKGNLIVQTIFLKGTINGELIDNYSGTEFDEYLKRLDKIKPQAIMIYSLDRVAPFNTIEALSKEELNSIAETIRNRGYQVDYYS